MRCNVYVDRDLLMSFEDEGAALAFVRDQFDERLSAGDVWLEIGEGDSAELLQGKALIRRLRSVGGSGRLSA